MKKIQDVLDQVDLDVNELPEPTQRRVQTYAKLEKQLIGAKLELEELDEPNPDKQQVYEDAITYFNDYEADVIQSIQAYANRLEHELQAKAMKERRDTEEKQRENQARLRAKNEAKERKNQERLRAKKEAQLRVEANQKRAKQEMSVAQAKAEADAQKAQAKAEADVKKAQAEAEEKARLEAEASKPKKKSGGLGFILAGLGIVAAVITFGATRDK